MFSFVLRRPLYLRIPERGWRVNWGRDIRASGQVPVCFNPGFKCIFAEVLVVDHKVIGMYVDEFKLRVREAFFLWNVWSTPHSIGGKGPQIRFQLPADW